MSKTNKYVVSFDDPGCWIIWCVGTPYKGADGVACAFRNKKIAIKEFKQARRMGLKAVLNVLTPVKVK